ncbi:unnamed protein product, partial [Adineta steineri]
VPYNQPKFCSSATWKPNAKTFADSSTIGVNPYGIFINTNNTIYVADREVNRVQIWFEGDMNPTKTFYGGMVSPFGIFISVNGDVYVDNGNLGVVDKWIWNSTSSTTAMYVMGICHGLFIDISNNLYCSLGDFNIVIKKSLNDTTNTTTVVVGNGTSGLEPNMLSNPHGIFIDVSFNLYVADRDNHRIQLFQPGELNATTVAGDGSLNITITLAYPTGIILDGNGYLFISDTNNNRIVGSNSDGYRCVVGCDGVSGLGSNQLNAPWGISFDSYGNLFVADAYNNRIQKFMLATNCGPSYNQPKFCSSATWNPNATNFANSSTVGVGPYGIFVNTNNTIYVADREVNRIQVWFEGDMNPAKTLSGGLTSPFGIFASANGDVYVDNGNSHEVDKWACNATSSITAMYVMGTCHGLFIDTSNTLYCSLGDFNLVVKELLNDTTGTQITAAGNGTSGLEPNMLNNPHGIFIDVNFNLYVADRDNHRIQLFQPGELNAITVAGDGSLNITITLAYPTGIILDGNGYLFISDTNNNRIVGSNSDGYRCIVGCDGVSGLGSNQLNAPWGISFDSYGNLFVADAYNNRIQKFMLATNCEPETTTFAITTANIEEETTYDTGSTINDAVETTYGTEQTTEIIQETTEITQSVTTAEQETTYDIESTT